MTADERIAKRTYPPIKVLEAGCAMLRIEPAQLSGATKDPEWAYMAREAIIGAVHELCIVGYVELAALVGHAHHSSLHSQVTRFQTRWPRHIRRSWIEALVVRLDHPDEPEFSGALDQIRSTLKAAKARHESKRHPD